MEEIKRIFIIGHPGAGKGVLGKSLAEKIGWKFIDADFGLEFHVGRTLTEILGKSGENAFHRCEHKVLESLLNKENIVVTTDAGIVCDEKNYCLLTTEFVVYLQVSTAVQLERTLRNATPFLLDTDLEKFFDKLHNERDDLYERLARLTINSDDSALENHVLTIVNNLFQKKNEKENIQKNIKKNINVPKNNSEQLLLEKKDLVFFHKTKHIPIHLSRQRALCLKLLAQGKSSKEIAKFMKISYRTVEKYLATIAELLGCSGVKELIALYHERP